MGGEGWMYAEFGEADHALLARHSQILTLKSTLLSLRSLLCSPEPSDPQDAEV